MRAKAAIYRRFAVVIALLGTLGIAGYAVVLVHQRAQLPFANVYTLRAAFTAANGVDGGVGQPVTVVGVQVGQVTGVTLRDGRAVVDMQIHRDKLPHVFADAEAALTPVTPLGDLEIQLSPGHDSSGGATHLRSDHPSGSDNPSRCALGVLPVAP